MSVSVYQVLKELKIRQYFIDGGVEPTNEDEFNSTFVRVEFDDNGIPVEYRNPSDFNVTWAQITSKKSDLESSRDLEWREVRQVRNELLGDVDWTQFPDVPETTRNKFQTYRQELRDITTQSDPSNITWPTKPS
jgi:hypothetical protein|tara:strand:+ start:681 stop:1082 length:402 start_codon:yes stop_codon:yes gene_type:complete